MRARCQALTVAGLSAFALACDDTSAPAVVRPPNAVDVVVEFCMLSPAWIAVKNEGYGWVSVPIASFATRYVLVATPKVAVAYGYASPSLPGWSDVRVFYVTAEELASHICGPPRGTYSLSAPVAGVAATDFVSASLGAGIGFLSANRANLSFFSVPQGPQDLVAYHRAANTFAPDKYIVRHDVAVSNGSVLPTVDFTSAEAVAPAPTAVVAPGFFGVPKAWYITNRGVATQMTGFAAVGDTSYVHMLPASVLGSGDAFSVSVNTSTLYATRYFATPGVQNFTFGQALSTPTVTTLASSPSLLLRVALPSQAEYPSLARATFSQDFGASYERRISVTVTAGYVGATPAIWTMDVPDLTSVITKDLLLANGTTTTWTVEGWNARATLFFSKFGAYDGEMVRCAKASSSFALSSCASPLLP